MQRFRLAIALVLAALWPLVTSHCRLEQIPGLVFLVCCEHDRPGAHQDSDCDRDGCAVFENGLYKSETDNPGVVPPATIVEAPPLHASWHDAMAVHPFRADSSELQFPTSWQFVFRAALPPRAPSALS